MIFSIFTVALMAASVWSASNPRVRNIVSSKLQVITVCTKASVRPPGGMVTAVRQHRELTTQCHFIYLAQGAHKSIILAISTGTFLIFLSVDFYLQRSHRLQSIRQIHNIALKADAFFCHSVLQYVRNDIGQVFLRHQLFLVAQLNDAFGHFAHGIFIQL